uniref:ANF_receptor domain-containing protein n=1 Tax=Steinernema glaseri TaxID=37863 RepID=A0A1I8AM91_9BILA
MKKIAAKYTLNPVDCILPKGMFYPAHVLDCLCNTLIKNKVSLIVFVTASESYDDTTSAALYFLHMASHTGIPIIAWNADNAGFSFNKPLSEYRILQMAPPITHQIKAMIALLKRYNWPKFGIVTSKMAGSTEFLQNVQEQIQSSDHRSFKNLQSFTVTTSLWDPLGTFKLRCLQLQTAVCTLLYRKRLISAADAECL